MLLFIFVLMIILQNRNNGYQIEKYSLPTDAHWSRGVYSPELQIWVTVGIPRLPGCTAVSGYSSDGTKWEYTSPTNNGLPVQYGPLQQYGWNSVAYGNTQSGPLFVAVSNGYDHWMRNGTTHYVNGQITDIERYVSVATSTDGIIWTTGTGLFPYGSWFVTYDPVSQFFQAVGDLADTQYSVYNSYGAQSIDGVNWQMTGFPYGNFEILDMCYGNSGIAAAGWQDGGDNDNVAVTNILPSSTTIWNLSSNIPSKETIFSVKFLQGAYFATGLYGLYVSTDGINWSNLNVTDVNATPLFTGGLINSDIDYFRSNFVLHICSGNGTGQFYYSKYPIGPYMLGVDNTGNIINDTFTIKLSSNKLIIIGLGYFNGQNISVVWSRDGKHWTITQ